MFAWDREEQRFVINEPRGLRLDGPHVFFLGDRGYEVVRTIEDGKGGWALRRERMPNAPAPTLRVRVPNKARTEFDVTLRADTVPDAGVYDAQPEKLLLLSDLEGEFDRFVALLQAQGVIDRDLHWRFGAGHVAIAGDMVDRGRDMIPLLWLIYRLEAEAEAAGGRVHYVLGNHEFMGMTGDIRYWPGHLRETSARLQPQTGYPELMTPRTVLGLWLARKPVMAKVGDTLIVHAGISRRFLAADLTIPEANTVSQSFLSNLHAKAPADLGAIAGNKGLLWYRGLAQADASDYDSEGGTVAYLRQVLKRYGAKRLAIGHTIVPNVRTEHEGLLLRLDVHHTTQTPEAALYENGRLWRVDAEGGRVALQ